MYDMYIVQYMYLCKKKTVNETICVEKQIERNNKKRKIFFSTRTELNEKKLIEEKFESVKNHIFNIIVLHFRIRNNEQIKN